MPGRASKWWFPVVLLNAALALFLSISAVPCLAQSPGDLKWVAPIANGQIFSSPSIAAGGTIYVGHAGSWPGLYAINPDGTQKWYFKPYSEVWTAPAIGSDGTIYFGTEGGEELFAVNPDGTEKWVLELFGEIFGSPAIGQDGTIYVGLDRPENDSFYAINPNGTVRWSLDTGYNIYSAPAIAPDGTIYVSQEEAFILLALRPDGSLKWSTDLPGGTGFYPAFQSSPAIGIDGAIYIGGGNGNLYAVNPDDGSIRWAYDTGAKIIASPAIGIDGTIYIGSWNGILSAVNPDGTSKWDFATGNEIDSSAAIGADGTIYFASWGGRLWAVNPDGTEKWQSSIGGNPFSSPMIGSDGTVYVGGYSNLYAFYSDSLGLAQSPWPAYRQDVERTGRGEFVPVPLTLGVPLQTGIEAGQAHYYSLETEADDSVLVQVTADSGITSLALYGQYEGLTYQTTTATPHGTWELNLAPTVGGQYLLMVYGTDVAGAGGVFTILADSVARHVSDVDPREAGNAGITTLLIRGLGFEEGMDVELTGAGPLLTAAEVTTSSPTELVAQFDLDGATLGTYDLTVVWPDVSSQTLTDAFEIVAGTGPELEAYLEVPEAIRADRSAVAWLVYSNVGDADMPAPLFTVRSNVFISIHGGRTISQRVEILGIGDSSDPTILRVGESRRIPVYFRSPKNPDASTFFKLAVTEETSQAIDWESQKYIMKPHGISTGEWDLLWPDLIAQLGSTWAEYVGTLRTDATRLGARGLPVYDVAELIGYELSLVMGNPVTAISGVLLHAETLEPLPGVTIRARSADELTVKETVTAYRPPGAFALRGLPDGDYDLFVDAYYFDPHEEVTVAGTDVTDLELHASEIADPVYESVEVFVPQQHPSITVDESGNLYMVWLEGEELWWAVNTGSGWTQWGAVPDAEALRPALVYDPELLDGGLTPGLFVVWEKSPVLEECEEDCVEPQILEYAVARITPGGLEWSEPNAITGDLFDDTASAVVVDPISGPVVLWLQRDFAVEDDSDLYYQEVDISRVVFPFLQTVDGALQVEGWDGCVGLPDIPEIGANVPKSIPVLGGKYGFKIGGKICSPLEGCSYFLEGEPSVTFDLGQFTKLVVKTPARVDWKLNSSECKFVYKKGSLSLSVDTVMSPIKYVVPLVIKAVPIGTFTLSAPTKVGVAGSIKWASAPSCDAWRPSAGGVTLSVGGGGSAELNIGLGAVVAKAGITLELLASYDVPPDTNCFVPVTDYGLCFKGECVKAGGEIIGLWGGLSAKGPFFKQWGRGCTPPSPISGNSFYDHEWARFNQRMDAQEGVVDGSLSVPIYEEIAFEKALLLGTGATYEGLPVLGDISGDLYPDGLPSVVRSSSGEILVVWTKDETWANLGARLWASTYDGTGWDTPEAVSSSVAFTKDPSVVFDSSDDAIAIWSHASNAGLDWDLNTIEELLAATELADIWYSLRGSSGWSAPTQLAALPGRDEQTALAAGPSGEAAAAWLNYSGSSWVVYGAIWSGSSWSTPAAIAGSVAASRPEIVYVAGLPKVIWSQDSDSDVDTFDDWRLYSSTWNGSFWSSPAPIDLVTPRTTDLSPVAEGGICDLLDPPDVPDDCCNGDEDPDPVDPPEEVQDEIDNAVCENVASVDPNEKIGTPGVGTDHLVEAGDRLSYTVYFENLPAANAPAQEVFVTDCLSPDLDWLSLQLTEVAFGDVILANPGEGASFNDRVTIPDYRGTGEKWWVDIESEFNFDTGCLNATFRTIDLLTGELPSDPFAGFLPPENGSGRGQGHIGFSVDTLGHLSDGTLITNDASIVFDANAPIVTNEVFNTIGTPSGSYTLSVTIAGPGTGSVTSSPPGIDCGSDCSETYPAWTQVGLIPHPGPKMKLTGWSGDADCDGGVVALDHNTSCTATFGPDPEVFSDGFESGDTLDWSITRQ